MFAGVALTGFGSTYYHLQPDNPRLVWDRLPMTLGFMGLTQIHEMNTLKTILGSLINLVAAAWFIAAGMVHWPKAGVMLAGAALGYYLGSHFSQRISPQRVRQLITTIGIALFGATFYQQFCR